MNIIELLGLSVALSMDAFAVAVCKGLADSKFDFKKALIVGSCFGFFQALMPLIGYYIGASVLKYIAAIDHWLIFGLLSYIGVNMIREARRGVCEADTSVNFKNMLMLSLATSIDALAAGLSLAFMQADIFISVAVIGVTTFLISIAGVRVGNVFGAKYKEKAETAGGIILIALGLKFLIQHLI
jgi:putative Mn2+ efflux pump MntP